jgi:hypothetical protein
MVKGKADLIWGSIVAGCATLLIIGFQHLLRNVDTPSAHGQWRALTFVTQQAREHQIWGLESCIMFFSFTILLNIMEFQEHSPRKFEIIMWSIWITMYIVHCSFCNVHLTLCFLICCFSNLLYFLYSLFWEFLCLTNNNWLDIWLFWHWVKKETELGHQVKTGFEGVWGTSSLYEGYQEKTKLWWD